MANLISFKNEGTAKQLTRYNRQRAVTISANINEGYTLTEAIKFFENVMADIAPKIKLPGRENLRKLRKQVMNYL